MKKKYLKRNIINMYNRVEKKVIKQFSLLCIWREEIKEKCLHAGIFHFSG